MSGLHTQTEQKPTLFFVQIFPFFFKFSLAFGFFLLFFLYNNSLHFYKFLRIFLIKFTQYYLLLWWLLLQLLLYDGFFFAICLVQRLLLFVFFLLFVVFTFTHSFCFPMRQATRHDTIYGIRIICGLFCFCCRPILFKIFVSFHLI